MGVVEMLLAKNPSLVFVLLRKVLLRLELDIKEFEKCISICPSVIFFDHPFYDMPIPFLLLLAKKELF